MGELSSRLSRTRQLFRRSSANNTNSSSQPSTSTGEVHDTKPSSSSSPSSTIKRKSSAHKLKRRSLTTQPAEVDFVAAAAFSNSNASPSSPPRPDNDNNNDDDDRVVQTPVEPKLPTPELTIQAASPEHKPRTTGFSPGRPLAPPTPQSQPATPANLSRQNTAPDHDSLKPLEAADEGSKQTSAPCVTKEGGVPVPPKFLQSLHAGQEDHFRGSGRAREKPSGRMARRKIWVKRTGQSATLVTISEEDLVDDVRDMIIRKYANSLGRTFDAPDVALRIVPREKSHADRVLGPEEEVLSTLEAFYPGGQHVEEALIIEVPQRRTPRPSPQPQYGYDQQPPLQQVQSQQQWSQSSHGTAHHRPAENGTDYFPQMPAVSPGAGHPPSSHDSRHSHHNAPHPHSISILETGQAPPLPSPRLRTHAHRPRNVRQNTSSPTGLPTSQASHRPNRPRGSSTTADGNLAPAPPPLPTPPITTDPRATGVDPLVGQPGSPAPVQPSTTSVAVGTPPADQHHRLSPRIPRRRNRRQTLPHLDAQDALQSLLPPGVLDGGVPPINVLIVEDNIINLKLLEQLAKRLKVRWQTAMNGRDAVAKWRTGGFHLVLMDIQLPIMSGLEATKEIRRLERVNGIGVFAKSEGERRESAATAQGDASAGTSNGDTNGTSSTNASKTQSSEVDNDKLVAGGIFKSPVIIVALTASSLQSDRHEALAAGCNDFLTKPVNFVWFERKVMEWGCMQALIDFDGWRKWKDQAAQEEQAKLARDKPLAPEEKARREKKEKRRLELMAKMGQSAAS